MFAGSWRWCVNDESDVFVGNLRNMLPISSNIYRTWSSQVWFHPFVSRRRESREPFATSSGIPRRFLASNWKFRKKVALHLYIVSIGSKQALSIGRPVWNEGALAWITIGDGWHGGRHFAPTVSGGATTGGSLKQQSWYLKVWKRFKLFVSTIYKCICNMYIVHIYSFWRSHKSWLQRTSVKTYSRCSQNSSTYICTNTKWVFYVQCFQSYLDASPEVLDANLLKPRLELVMKLVGKWREDGRLVL